MPPDYTWLLDGGLPAVLLAIAWLLWQRASKLETERDAERTARNTEALAAAKELFAEQRSSDKARDIIERRDELIAELRHDIDQLERSLERCEQRLGSEPMPPRLEAGS